MEQVQAKNEDLHLPYQQLPTKKQKKIKIYCLEYGHRDQKVEYLNLTPESDVIKSRLQCIKCVNGPYSHFRQDVAILKEILSDSINILKNTQFQGNLCQEFSNLYHSLNLDISKDDIEFKFAQYQKQFEYQLQVCKQVVLKSYDEYQEIKEKIKQYVEGFQQIFDFSTIQQELINYANEGPNPSPKLQKDINDSLNKYVKKLHDKQSEKRQTDFDQLKTKVNEFTKKNCFHFHKLDQGMESIQNILEEMKKTFSPNNFTQSELSNHYITEVLTTINKDYSEFTKVEKIQPIYSSIHEGLNYKNILDKLKVEEKSDLLFIFKCSNSQRFGAFITPLLDKSLLFSLSKKQIYMIKSGVKALDIKRDANDNSLLLKFGNEDLIIQSTFTRCYSKLGSGFDANPYQIGNKEMHLANALEFEIYALEIFKL